MEFQRERVFTSLNADELKAGDKVIVADQLSVLKQRVQEGKKDSAIVLQRINGEDWGRRFGSTMSDYALAYLVERAENCANCHYAYLQDEGVECALQDEPKPTLLYEDAKLNRCRAWGKRAEPKTEPDEICINCEYYSTYGGYCNKHDKPTRYDNTCPDYLLGKPQDCSCENFETEPKNKKEINMDNWNYLNYFGCSLPEKQEMGTSDHVVVAVKGYNVPDVGYYDWELKAWFVDGNRYPVPVYAWMAIKPPKEEA